MRYLAIFILFLGLSTLSGGFWLQSKERDTLSWERTLGKVDSQWLVTKSLRQPKRFRLLVNYEYTAGNARYTGSNFAGRTSLTSRQAEEEQRIYQRNQPITVYFDPKNPQNSVLKPGEQNSGGLIGMGVVLTALSLILLCPHAANLLKRRSRA